MFNITVYNTLQKVRKCLRIFLLKNKKNKKKKKRKCLRIALLIINNHK